MSYRGHPRNTMKTRCCLHFEWSWRDVGNVGEEHITWCSKVEMEMEMEMSGLNLQNRPKWGKSEKKSFSVLSPSICLIWISHCYYWYDNFTAKLILIINRLFNTKSPQKWTLSSLPCFLPSTLSSPHTHHLPSTSSAQPISTSTSIIQSSWSDLTPTLQFPIFQNSPGCFPFSFLHWIINHEALIIIHDNTSHISNQPFLSNPIPFSPPHSIPPYHRDLPVSNPIKPNQIHSTFQPNNSIPHSTFHIPQQRPQSSHFQPLSGPFSSPFRFPHQRRLKSRYPKSHRLNQVDGISRPEPRFASCQGFWKRAGGIALIGCGDVGVWWFWCAFCWERLNGGGRSNVVKIQTSPTFFLL